MERIDFEKMGFNLELPTIYEVLKKKSVNKSFKNFSINETKLFIQLNCMEPENLLEAVRDQKWQSEFLVKIANNWMKQFQGVFDERVWMYVILCFSVDNPGKLNVFIARCLQYYLEKNKPITPDIISMEIFPFGFYDDETVRNIIDLCMKPRASLFSEIY